MNPERLDEILERAAGLKVAVVGDFFLDKYFDIDRGRAEVSLETGREAHQVVGVRCYPGAAGSAAQKLAALGVGGVVAVTVVGRDGEGFDLRRALEQDGVDTGHVIEAEGRRTGTYIKPMMHEGSGPAQELERLDIKNYERLGQDLENRVMAAVNGMIDEVDGVVIVDQAPEPDCGVITARVRQFLCNMAAVRREKVFFVDSRCRVGEFRGVIAKPNRSELAEAVGMRSGDVASGEEIEVAAQKLVALTDRPVLVTLGADGVLAVDRDGARMVPGYVVSGEIDIVGAGDSVTAGVVTGLCAGASLVEAALLGNLTASITVQQIGVTGTARPEQVRRRLGEYLEQRR